MRPDPATPSARSEMLAGLKQGTMIGFAALLLVLPPLAVPKFSAPASQRAALSSPAAPALRALPRAAELRGHAATADARFVADWVADSRDNAGMPFVILDKRDARLFVFDADARLIDSSPVLLGLAAGDDSVPDIGSRPIAQVRPEERTTPAGRFVSTPGRNDKGEDIVWVDYDAAVSMHRVRPIDPKERRLERLASADPRERRISYGCINIPVAFFDGVVKPAVGQRKAVVYVLPETRPVGEVFAGAYAVAKSGDGTALARSN
jgi:hypothetical protein